MKKLFTIVAICLIVVSSQNTSEEIKKLQEETRRVEEYRKPCLIETGLYSDSIAEPAKSPSLEQIFCLWACLLRKNGSIKPDGSVDENVIRLKNPELTGPLDLIIQNCELQANGNTCKLAGCLAKAHFNLLE